MKLKYICKICNKEISSHGLGMHIKWHNLTKKEYYDKFLKKENEGICLRCGKETNFINIHSGYFKYCSCECSANSIEKQNSIKQTCLIKYGKTYNCVADKLGFSAYKLNMEYQILLLILKLEKNKEVNIYLIMKILIVVGN